MRSRGARYKRRSARIVKSSSTWAIAPCARQPLDQHRRTHLLDLLAERVQEPVQDELDLRSPEPPMPQEDGAPVAETERTQQLKDVLRASEPRGQAQTHLGKDGRRH